MRKLQGLHTVTIDDSIVSSYSSLCPFLLWSSFQVSPVPELTFQELEPVEIANLVFKKEGQDELISQLRALGETPSPVVEEEVVEEEEVVAVPEEVEEVVEEVVVMDATEEEEEEEEVDATEEEEEEEKEEEEFHHSESDSEIFSFQ